MNTELAIIFDLDDTLYKERNFLVSAFRAIGDQVEKAYGLSDIFPLLYSAYERGEDAFQHLIDTHHLPLSKAELLEVYRTHMPDITLLPGTTDVLGLLRAQGIMLGLMTDGRSTTQRNKIHTLGLDRIFEPEAILISEEFGSAKPSVANYRYFMQLFGRDHYVYVGDNTAKDFIAPQQLGWTSACLLDDGRNIHPQDRTVPALQQPSVYIRNITELPETLNLFYQPS